MAHNANQLNILENLLLYSGDAIFEVIFYLSGQDCVNLLCTNSSWKSFMSSEKIWWYFSKYRIPGFLVSDMNHQQNMMLKSLMKILGINSYQDLYRAFHSLSFPLTGYFQLVPHDSSTSHGGLYKIQKTETSLYCEHLDIKNGRIEESFSFNMYFDSSKQKLLASNKKETMKFEIEITDKLILKSIKEDNVHYELKAVKNHYSERIDEYMENWIQFKNCLGLHIGRYGSHGMEILHLSMRTPEDSEYIRHRQIDFGSVQLQGYKITGDPNIPAGKYSFCINMLSTVDYRRAANQDPRPIIISPSDGTEPFITTLRERIKSINYWARGYGQINRDPIRWNPEWVSCNFISYKSPIERSQTIFSILWDDDNDVFRHAMDFRAFPH